MVEPKVEGVTLDLKNIFLKVENGTVFTPKSYVGPVQLLHKYAKERYKHSLCGEGVPKNIGSSNLISLEAGGQYCFAFEFQTPPPLPDEDYSIEIRGLKSSGQEIVLPMVTYQTEIDKEIHN